MNLDCPHFNQGCSGCVVQERVTAPPILEEARLFFKEQFDYDLLYSHGEITGWRTRAKLAVRKEGLGLFKEGTHTVVPIPCCRVQHPKLNQAAELIRGWIAQENIEPYDEISHRGQLRYLQLTLEHSSGGVQGVLVINQPIDKEKLEALQHLGGELWHSLWVNVNTSRTNTIFGKEWEHFFGEEWLIEKLLGRPYYFHPASFIQANLEQYERLLVDLVDQMKPHKKVVEFYAGAGAIGLSALSKSSHVLLSEYNKEARLCFQKSYEKLTVEEQNKCAYHLLDAAKASSLLEGQEVVIVDPPRKGVEPALLEKIIKSKTLKQLIMVSCGWPSLKREAAILKSKGFTLEYAKGYLFFPGTNQLEILSIYRPRHE